MLKEKEGSSHTRLVCMLKEPVTEVRTYMTYMYTQELLLSVGYGSICMHGSLLDHVPHDYYTLET